MERKGISAVVAPHPGRPASGAITIEDPQRLHAR